MERLRRRLRGESRKGFSLVELIIVIAILAILVGIIALQVIPYLERSRESKDISQLDSLHYAFVTALAEENVAKTYKGDIAATAYTGTGTDVLQMAIFEKLNVNGADMKASMTSAKATGELYFERTGGVTKVFLDDGSKKPAVGDYGTVLEVASTKSATAPTTAP